MLFVQFIGVAPGSAGGPPDKKFCRGNVNAAKSNFVTPYKVCMVYAGDTVPWLECQILHGLRTGVQWLPIVVMTVTE